MHGTTACMSIEVECPHPVARDVIRYAAGLVRASRLCDRNALIRTFD